MTASTKPFASLTPTLLARKGGAKPAMRPQLAPLHQFNEATALEVEDLGWNDMGDEPDESFEVDALPEQHEAEIVPFNGSMQGEPQLPQVLRQREAIAGSLSDIEQPRRSARSEGRRAAFTLRLDAERHLQLRLASTIGNRSAQQIVTEALDRLLSEMPEVAALADRVRQRG
jgi:hypothetical protein